MNHIELRRKVGLLPNQPYPRKLQFTLYQNGIDLQEGTEINAFLRDAQYTVSTSFSHPDGGLIVVALRDENARPDPADLLRETIEVMDDLVKTSEGLGGKLTARAWRLRDQIEDWLGREG